MNAQQAAERSIEIQRVKAYEAIEEAVSIGKRYVKVYANEDLAQELEAQGFKVQRLGGYEYAIYW